MKGQNFVWPLLLAGISGVTRGEPIDGFTEPYRSINIATAEVGVIQEVHVREGDRVEKHQPVAALDSDLQAALLSIARKNTELRGRVDSARAELELRRQRLKKLEQLLDKGHARREEVARARADLAIAEAQLLSAEEELIVRHLEYDKIEIQLKRRTILSPLDGIVATLHKEAGEFVAPNDPHIANIVQLDRLLCNFSVPGIRSTRLAHGEVLTVRMMETNKDLQGTVEYISPVTDAESGTVRVKVRIDNPEGTHRSGQRCSLELP